MKCSMNFHNLNKSYEGLPEGGGVPCSLPKLRYVPMFLRGRGTLGISGWGCATMTLEPLAYTRASFSWILLPYTRVNSSNHSYPRVAVFQKLRSLAQSKAKPKQALYHNRFSLKKGFIYTCPSFFSIVLNFRLT